MKKLLIETTPANVLGKAVYTLGLGLMVALILSHCTSVPTAPSGSAKAETYPPTLASSCMFSIIKNDTLTQDSLIIGTKKYTVSTRSRYRALGGNEYLDTKTDSLFIIYPCEGK